MSDFRVRAFAPLAYGPGLSVSKLAGAAVIALVALAASARAEVTIIAFGDSLTQGYGLPEAEGFVPQMRAWLAENGAADVRLVNAGVSGDTTAGGRARIAWTLQGEPADGVLVALGGNDLLRGTDPAETRANLDAILAEIDAAGLPIMLAGLPASGNFGPEFQAEFDAIFPDLAEAYDAILYPSFLAGLGEGARLSEVRHLMQPDGIHPNAEGVAAIVAHMGPVLLDLVEAARGPRPDS